MRLFFDSFLECFAFHHSFNYLLTLTERTHRIPQLTGLLVAKVLLEGWSREYNLECLHSSICYLPQSISKRCG
jgi:hypothetical protein